MYRFLKRHWVITLLVLLGSAFPLAMVFRGFWLAVCPGDSYGERLSQFNVPIDIPITLSEFDQDAAALFLRYLTGNPRWEVRETDGQISATRRDLLDGEIERRESNDSELVSTSVGWYLYIENGITIRQSLVRISFGPEVGFGDRLNPVVTRTSPGSQHAKLWTFEIGYEDSTVYHSLLVARGDYFNIEISDETPDPDRSFTKTTLQEIDEELRAVLRHSDEIQETGRIPNQKYYPYEPATEPSVTIGGPRADSGIFLVKAQLNLQSKGVVETRVFNAETNKQLSAKRLVPTSRRHVGWSKQGETFFEYNTKFKLYEGEVDEKFLARFEIWHITSQGEYKVGEKEQLVNAWRH